MKKAIGSYLTMLSVALLGGVLTLGGYKLFMETGEGKPIETTGYVENKTPVNVRTVSALSGLPSFTEASALSTPAVVHIKSNIVVQTRSRSFFGDPWSSDFFEDFFNPRPRNRNAQASGSGVISSPDGYIVTNHHVIKDANTVEVVLHDGRSYEAQIVGTDPSTDLALLKVDEKQLPYLPMGNSDELLVGDWVLAVGNPFNLASTVTAGIVSAKARNINILQGQSAIESFIQTDAAVNPGNSGGALVNAKGELVGINTAIASPTGAYSGYSFAVPVEIVKKVVQDLMVHGVVQRAYLGAEMIELNGEVANKLELDRNQGIYIDRVIEGGSVANAGLLAGDIIIAIDGKTIRKSSELQEYVGRHRPGDVIEAEVLRNDRVQTVSVELQNSMGTTDVVHKQEARIMEDLGVELEPLSSKELAQLNLKGGVRILNIQEGKIRQFTDIRPGFVITRLDNQTVEDVAELERILQNKTGGVMLEGIYPDRPGKYYYAFGL